MQILLVILHGHFSIQKYHAISHVFQQKNRMSRKEGTPIDACLGLLKLNTLRRVFTVNPRQTECFYLQLLLVNVTDPLSFQDIRKVNGQQYPTYKDACLELSLLEDDNHWECMLAETGLNCIAK